MNIITALKHKHIGQLRRPRPHQSHLGAGLPPQLCVLGQTERTRVLPLSVALEAVLVEGVWAEEVHRRQVQRLTARRAAGPLKHHRAGGWGGGH